MSSTTSTTQSSKLQAVNYANVIAYVLNVAVTYAVGASDLFDLPTNAELSAKYQTLVTPAGYAFAIWGIIFVAQLVWVVAQLTPAYRSNELVIKGVGYYYVAVCVAQIAWTLVFSHEYIIASLAAMVAILIALMLILLRQSSEQFKATESIANYWLLKFPFDIHAGWICAATLVNANVVLVSQEVPSGYQVVSGWASLVFLAITALYFTYQHKWVIPAVLAWASYAISVELTNPKELIVNTFSDGVIEQVRFASAGLVVTILVAEVILAAFQWRKNNGADNNDESGTAYHPIRES